MALPKAKKEESKKNNNGGTPKKSTVTVNPTSHIGRTIGNVKVNSTTAPIPYLADGLNIDTFNIYDRNNVKTPYTNASAMVKGNVAHNKNKRAESQTKANIKAQNRTAKQKTATQWVNADIDVNAKKKKKAYESQAPLQDVSFEQIQTLDHSLTAPIENQSFGKRLSFEERQAQALNGLNNKSKSALEALYNASDVKAYNGAEALDLFQTGLNYSAKKKREEEAKNALKEQGIDNFDSVYEYYAMNRDKEKTQKAVEAQKRLYNKANGVQKVASNLGTIVETLPNTMQAIPELLKQPVNADAPLNIYSDAFRGKNLSDATREATREDIDNEALKTVYDIGMGIGDTVASMPVYAVNPIAGAAVTGANATVSGAKEATERGVSRNNAIATGLTSGVIEAVTEKIPMDELFKVGKSVGKTGVKNVVKSALKQSGIEATEETVSTLANAIADGAINGEDSQYNQAVQSYINAGYSEADAKKQANNAFLKNVGASALGGAVSGGILGGAAQAYNWNKYSTLSPLEDAQTQDSFGATREVKKTEIPTVEAQTAEVVTEIPELKAEMPKTETALSNQKGNISGAMSEDRGQYVRNDSYSASFNDSIPTQNATVNEVNKVPLQEHIDMVNQLGNSNTEVKNSRYSTESIPNKSDLPDEVTQIFVDNPTTYNVLKNADTKAKADSILQSSNNVYDTVSEYKKMLDCRDASAIPLGYELSKKLIDSGDVNTAVDIIRDMSTALTKSGQFTQAAAMTLLHENPQAAMRYAVKEIDSINTAGKKKFGAKWKNIALTDDEINSFSNIKAGDTDAIKGIYESIGNRIAKEYPATKWEKFVELTKIGMLLNPRTHIRNIVSNTILAPIRSLSDRVSAIGMNVAHIINPDIKVTQSLTGGGRKYKKSAEEVWESVKDGILGTDDKWDDLSGSVFRKQVFKDSKVGTFAKEKEVALVRHLGGEKLDNVANSLDDNLKGSFLENVRNFNYYLLGDVEDNPFVKKNFVNRLASYMKAQNITDVSDVPPEAITLATDEALKATFKDDNALTRTLSSVKKNTGKFGEVILPFTKTPANLAVRGIDYSPAGLVRTFNKVRNKEDFSAVMDSLSKNLVGTLAIALGYRLAKSGIIQGALSDDKDEAEFQKQQGKQAYSVVVNGTSYTFDWAQPASIPLIIGATIYDSIAEDDANIANYAWQGTKAAVNSWVELSSLQSFSDILGGNGYGQNDVAGNVMSTVAEMPLRLIPAVGNAVANTRDTSQRLTFNNGDTVGSLINQAKSKIPFLRETLPQAYDTWGNPKVNANSTKQAAFNNFISPGKSAVNASTPIDSEIQRLYDATGNNAVFPRKAEWSVKVGSETIKLTAEQYSDYQKGMGEFSYQLAENFINSDSYKNMSDVDRVEALNDLYGYSKALYDSEVFGKPIPSTYSKLDELGGTEYFPEYLEYRSVIHSYDMDDTDNVREVWNAGGREMIQEFAEYKSVLEPYEANDSDKMRNIWNEHGEQGINDYFDIRNSSLKTNEKGNQTVDKTLLMQNLMRTNMTEEEKGYWYMNVAGQDDKDDAVYADFGYDGVYRYHIYKLQADAPGKKTGTKDGKISKTEAINYLNSTNMTRQEKHDWYNLLVPKNDVAKNPY